MYTFWRRVRSNWRRVDTWVFGGNTAALLLFAGNCYWHSVTATYLACLLPLTLQAWASRNDATLRYAFWFGAIIGWSWPIGEGTVVRLVGWWGQYEAPGLRVWDTPLYCILIGWLAGAYCLYVGRRVVELGYGRRGWALASGSSALFIGTLGENLFVWSGMWEYYASPLHVGAVPVFLPLAYGLGYAALPLLAELPLVAMALVFNVLMIVPTVGLGLLFGFFPRGGWFG